MPSSQLFRDSQEQFRTEAKDRYKSSTDIKLLQNFPPQNMVPKDATEQAKKLIERAEKKYPRPWINKLMENIGSIVTIGNHATTGAPESVGLAWFAVKLTISAMQKSYLFIESALMEITDVMIIVSHYDRLYDERSKVNGLKPNDLVKKLFDDIKNAYTAVIHFCFFVQRHLVGSRFAKIGHAIRDILGESKAKFGSNIDRISDCKRKILDGSEAIFQDETLRQINAIKGAVNENNAFQKAAQEIHKELDAKLTLTLKGVDTIVHTMLEPSKVGKLKEWLHIDSEPWTSRHRTCADHRMRKTGEWLLQHDLLMAWAAAGNESQVLALEGASSTGKTYLAIAAIEHLQVHARNCPTPAAVAYLFDRTGILSTTGNFVRAVLFQLCIQNAQFFKLAQSMLDSKQNTKREELWDSIIQKVILKIPELTCYIVLDGLDLMSI